MSRHTKAHTTAMRQIRRTKNIELPTIPELYPTLTSKVKQKRPNLTKKVSLTKWSVNIKEAKDNKPTKTAGRFQIFIV
jgi:hypothetical protein